MELTARFGLPLLIAGQGQKEITHNEALLLLDAAISCVVERRDLQEPPVAPEVGQCWLVGIGAGGEWVGKAGHVTVWTEGGWRFFLPPDGATLFVKLGKERLRRLAGSWQIDAPTGEIGSAVASPSGGSVIDSEARAAVDAILDRLKAAGLIAAS
jgi:hypothetical protein